MKKQVVRWAIVACWIGITMSLMHAPAQSVLLVSLVVSIFGFALESIVKLVLWSFEF